MNHETKVPQAPQEEMEVPPAPAEETKVPLAPPELTTAAAQGFTTLGISGSSSPGAPSRWAETEGLRAQMQSGAKWFYWIAGLSLINSIAAVSGSEWSFLAGLGITQLISGFALGLSEEVGGSVNVIAFMLDLLVAAFFVSLGVWANKGDTWAFVLGLVVYALDGIIFLVFQLWFSLAFHAFVIFSLYRGLAANRKLKQLEAEIATAT
jgi:hypothetical protein